VFVDSFSMADFGPESMKSGYKPGIGFSSAFRYLDSLEMIGNYYLSSKEERVVLYEINREPRDVGGLVMSLEV